MSTLRHLGARGGIRRVASRWDFRRGLGAEAKLYRAYYELRRHRPRRKDQARRRDGFHHGLLVLPFALALALACDSSEGEDDHSHAHETGDESQSDCEAETRDDEFAIGLSKSSESVTVTFVAADPAPPVNGDNTWTVALTDAGGQPLPDASITGVMPWMPDHGHGTAVEATATATENPGEFVITPIDFHMNGLWEVTLDIQVQPDTTEQVVFAFCVE